VYGIQEAEAKRFNETFNGTPKKELVAKLSIHIEV
jgi:hypothetical protein